MSTYDTVIFDLDGTLLDTLEDLTDSVNYILKKNGMKEHTLEEVRCYVGNGLHKLLERAVEQGTSDDRISDMFEEFCAYYATHCAIKTRPYDGILELLDDLRQSNIKIGIVSNKGDFAVKELNRLYFEGKIGVAIGERENIARKPAPDAVFEALKELHANKKKAVYVGDSEVDIATAKNASLACISVTWGFRDREFLRGHGAVSFVDKPSQLFSFLQES